MASPQPREGTDDEEVRALTKVAHELLVGVEAFRLITAIDYLEAAERLKQVKAKQKELKARREKITKPLNEALRSIRELFGKPESALDTAESILKGAISAYDAEQERQRREQQRRLDEAAEKDRQRLLQQAQRAAAKGNSDKAAQLEERASMTVAPIVQHEAPRVAGIARRENWRAEVVDLRALIVAVAEGRVPLAAVQANSSFLAGQARALRGELRYPGVRVMSDKTIAAGTA